jgi:ring-1,2-phenylacetyl-CoA epoxidase subunit PaaE
MSKSFHTLTVSEVRRETPDAVSICFRIPPELAETFRFTQGQNIAVRKLMDGAEIRRNYSICSAPGEPELRIAVKQIENGLFSTYANTSLKVGDQLEVMPPAGKFHVPLEPGSKRLYMAFAAGSGITPVMSIVKTTLQVEPQSEFILVYGNRNRQQIMFREELEALKNRYLSRFQVVHVLSREETDTVLNTGRIDADKCRMIHQKLVDLQSVDAFFLCGPEAMIFSVRDSLQGMGVSANRIHFELFHTDSVQKDDRSSADRHAVSGKEALAQVSVKLDGIVTRFELAYDGDSILNAALRQGIDLPFACKGGMCCTCRAKLEEGQVDMDRNYALEPDEVEAGFILTCQSHPRTAKVSVNFDLR